MAKTGSLGKEGLKADAGINETGWRVESFPLTGWVFIGVGILVRIKTTIRQSQRRMQRDIGLLEGGPK